MGSYRKDLIWWSFALYGKPSVKHGNTGSFISVLGAEYVSWGAVSALPPSPAADVRSHRYGLFGGRSSGVTLTTESTPRRPTIAIIAISPSARFLRNSQGS